MGSKQPKKAQRKRRKRKLGRPTKEAPRLFKAVLGGIAHGLTREEACRANGISLYTWRRWERLPEFSGRPDFCGLRERALATRIRYLHMALETCTGPALKRSWNRI